MFFGLEAGKWALTAQLLDQLIWEEWEISKATARKEGLLDADGFGVMDDTDFGSLGLNLLVGLDVKHQRPINLSESGAGFADEANVNQIWAYLRRQGIVRGEVAEGALTVSGRKSLHAALGANAGHGARQDGSSAVPAGKAASLLLLAVMRHHFSGQMVQG